MIFGNKDTIAIQFKLYKNYGERWMWGEFCFYFNNQQIGYYNICATLSDVRNGLEYIIKNKSQRYYPQLFKLHYREILEKIIHTSYSDNDDQLPNFYIDAHDECIDCFFIYVIDDDHQSKIIYGQSSQSLGSGKRTHTY